MSEEEQYVTRSEFLLLAARVDACEADRKEIRTRVSTLDTEVVDIRADLAELNRKQDAQTIILERLDKLMSGVAANPKVRLLAQMLFAALIAWLASKGFHMPIQVTP